MANRSLVEQLDEVVQGTLENPRAQLPQAHEEVFAMARIAAELRSLPRPDFKARLKAELRRRKSMTTVAEPVAAVRTAAAPILTFKDVAKAIDFYQKALGARETMRFQIEESIAHAEIMIGTSTIKLAEESPAGR